MTENPHIAKTIDTSGTRCPIPILRTKQALKSMSVGEVLEVLATDPATQEDMQAMLRHVSHTLLSVEKGHGDSSADRFLIQKGEG